MRSVLRFLAGAAAVCLACCMAVTAFASGSVSYEGRAEQFVFAPGSQYSPTDLFGNFKGIMPGDTLFDEIEVRATPKNTGQVTVYMRSAGMEEESKEGFLSQLQLKVTDSRGGVVFDGTLAEASEYVCLGVFRSGDRQNLDLTLYAPLEMDNPYQEAVGKLRWEFLAEENPSPTGGGGGGGKGDVPKTGDSYPVELLAWVMGLSACGLTLAAIAHKRHRQ